MQCVLSQITPIRVLFGLFNLPILSHLLATLHNCTVSLTGIILYLTACKSTELQKARRVLPVSCYFWVEFNHTAKIKVVQLVDLMLLCNKPTFYDKENEGKMHCKV